MEVTVYVNNDDNTYQVKVGADTLDIGNFGAWIPMSTSDDVGAASQASDAKVGSIKIKNVHSSWYGGIILDNVELSKWTELSLQILRLHPIKLCLCGTECLQSVGRSQFRWAMAE